MPTQPQKPWKRGDAITADRLQGMQDRPITNVRVAAPLRMLRNGNDLSLSIAEEPSVRMLKFLGVVTNAGPEAEANYTDERYWIKLSYVDGTDSVTTAAATTTTHITTSFDVNATPAIITATNLAELNLDKEESGIAARQSGTHQLPLGIHVMGFLLLDRAAPSQNQRWVFTQVPDRVVKVYITEAAAGNGKYYGKIIRPITAQPTAADDLTLAMVGSVGDENDCLILNMHEIDKATHDLTDDGMGARAFIGVMAPQKSDEDLHVVYINGLDFDDC